MIGSSRIQAHQVEVTHLNQKPLERALFIQVAWVTMFGEPFGGLGTELGCCRRNGGLVRASEIDPVLCRSASERLLAAGTAGSPEEGICSAQSHE